MRVRVAACVLGLIGSLAACGEGAGPSPVARDAETSPDVSQLEPDAARADAAQADAAQPDAGSIEDDAAVIEPDAGAPADKDPVVFVHGINGSSADFARMIDRLVADGWPRDHLRAIDFADPRWGCNVDNAEAIRTEVEGLLAATGAERVDLVAHSMGTLSSRQYLKNLGGTDRVRTYVTLGGLHYGNQLACLNPLPVCVWQELCPDNMFLSELNADPAAPGDQTQWVSICSSTDETAGLDTCVFPLAENIEVSGVDHAGMNGLLEHPDVYPHVTRVLEY